LRSLLPEELECKAPSFKNANESYVSRCICINCGSKFRLKQRIGRKLPEKIICANCRQWTKLVLWNHELLKMSK
jgi:hypothetical protein